MRVSSHNLLAAVTWGMAALLLAPAGAAPVRVDREVAAGRVTLCVNRQRVATLVRSDGVSAEDRARRVVARLSSDTVSSTPPPIAVAKIGGLWTVTVRGGALVAPGHGDAVRAGVSRRVLAHRWASRLRAAWKVPMLRCTPCGVVVGVGAARALRVSGAARGSIQAALDAPGRASVSVEGGRIILAGLRPGRATLTIRRDGARVACPVRVMEFAGSVRPVTVQVTGGSVPAALLSDAVDAEVVRSVRLRPGAWCARKGAPRYPRVWTWGDRLHYSVPVRLAGPGYLPVQTALRIEVIRRHLPTAGNVTLFYSNNPESVRDPQVLFHHDLDGAPARLLYHHQNIGLGPLTLAVDVTNRGDTDVPVQIVDATIPPAEDCVLAGHRAALKYLKRMKSSTGVILTVPAHGQRRLLARSLQGGDTLSGLMLIRPLVEGKMSVTVQSEKPNQVTKARDAQTDAVFPNPDKVLDAAYSVAGPWAYVPIGKTPSSNGDGVSLDGDYGVVYTVRLHVQNPTEKRRNVRVLFEPRAGEARAAVMVNGVLTEVGSTFPPAEARVATITLGPRQNRTVTLVTMPAAGSSYPAAFIVRG